MGYAVVLSFMLERRGFPLVGPSSSMFHADYFCLCPVNGEERRVVRDRLPASRRVGCLPLCVMIFLQAKKKKGSTSTYSHILRTPTVQLFCCARNSCEKLATPRIHIVSTSACPPPTSLPPETPHMKLFSVILRI